MLFSGFWCHVTWDINTDISKESVASIFYPEDGGSRFLCSMGTYLPDCMISHPKWQYLHSLCHENSHVTSVWVIFITVAHAKRVRTSQVINSVVSSSHLLQIVCHCYAWHCYSLVLQGWKYGKQGWWQLRFEHPLPGNCPSKCWVRPSWTVSAKGRGVSSSWHCCILLCVGNIGSYSMFRDCL
jgi:hypothetical protein